jgi:hypothetical protein
LLLGQCIVWINYTCLKIARAKKIHLIKVIFFVINYAMEYFSKYHENAYFTAYVEGMFSTFQNS